MPSPIRSFLSILAFAAMAGVLLWREHSWQTRLRQAGPSAELPPAAAVASGTAPPAPPDATAESQIATLQASNGAIQQSLLAAENRANTLAAEVETLKQALEAAKPEPTPEALAQQYRTQRGLAFEPPPAWVPSSLEVILDKIRSRITGNLPAASAGNRARAAVAMGYHTDPFDYLEAIVSLAQMTSGGFYEAAGNQFLYREEASLARADGREAFINGLSQALSERQAGDRAGNLQDPANDDAALAARSLISGDANASRVRFSIADQLRLNFNQSGAPTAPPPNYSAPAYLAEIWKFSQDKGSLFVEVLSGRGGNAAVDDAYRRLPKSSAEILHPEELYLAEPPFHPVEVEFPSATLAEKAPYFANVAGEIGVYVTLRAWVGVDEATLASEGWAGDRYMVWPGEDGVGDHLFWKSVWRSEKDAKEFFAMMRQILMQRFSIPWRKEYDAVPGQFSVDDPRRIIRLVLQPDGKTVTLANSTDPVFAEALQKASQTW